MSILCVLDKYFFFSSRRRHTRQESVSWARRCVQETDLRVLFFRDMMLYHKKRLRHKPKILHHSKLHQLRMLKSSLRRLRVVMKNLILQPIHVEPRAGISNTEVPNLLQKQERMWLHLPQRTDNESDNEHQAQRRRIRVMSYNVLASCYIYKKYYPDCDPKHLDWNHRQNLIYQEIREIDPDVICLQEIDMNEARGLAEGLKQCGYEVHTLRSIISEQSGLIN
eukprot:TRINITY_DN2090_c0_g1_i3.p2 TRINITY_DN2090_c0_g1~~TRINITY_DN2090_c0_g1_i3.p2  ORF type:complete len:223 (+),score=30.69 TRINITY_DN2090_c0_g1_i3:38-706(+)